MRNILLSTCTVLFIFVNMAYSQNTIVDGAKKYQTIHGLGVNINPQSWNVNPREVNNLYIV